MPVHSFDVSLCITTSLCTWAYVLTTNNIGSMQFGGRTGVKLGITRSSNTFCFNWKKFIRVFAKSSWVALISQLRLLTIQFCNSFVCCNQSKYPCTINGLKIIFLGHFCSLDSCVHPLLGSHRSSTLTCTILSIPRALSSSASSLSSVPLRKETSCSNRAFSSLRPSGVVGGPSTSSSVQGTHCLLTQRNTTSYGTGTHYHINVTGLDQLLWFIYFLPQFLHGIQCFPDHHMA